MSGKSIQTVVSMVVLSVLCIRPAGGDLATRYPLDEGRGTSIADVSGNGRNGTLIGSGARWVAGPAGFGKALRFPGTAPGPFVNAGRWDPAASTNRLSVAVWIKWEGPTDYYQGIVSKRDGWSATGTCWSLLLNQADGNISFSRYDCHPSFGTHIPPINEWQEIIVTFDGRMAALYTNGQEVGRSGDFSFGPKRNASIVLGDADPIGWNPFHGAIDEVRLYDEALIVQQSPPLSEQIPPDDELLPPLAEGMAWRLVWRDEFDGSEVNPCKWELLGDWQRHDGFWVQEDSYLDGQGHLILRTKKDGNRYTCGAVRTRGKFDHRYGYWVCRCQFPKEPGHWPAFWLMSDSVGRIGDDGRDGTEIDIMEKPWRDDRINQALHWDGYDQEHQSVAKRFSFPGLSEGLHTFGVHWTPEEYVFYVDGMETWRTCAGGVSQLPAYAKLTEEIGTWGGDIKKAKLPDYFIVDYVRVYDAVSDVPVAAVLVSEGFESGGFAPIGWQHGGNLPWWVTSSQKHAGEYSARAAMIGHGQTSTLKATGLCSAGNFSFLFKTSTESGDKLVFKVDGQQKLVRSGESGWMKATLSIAAGTHTFEWSYVKNASASGGQDTVWIDDVAFP